MTNAFRSAPQSVHGHNNQLRRYLLEWGLFVPKSVNLDSKEQVPAKKETGKTKKKRLLSSLLDSSNSKEEKESPATKNVKVVKAKELDDSDEEESSNTMEAPRSKTKIQLIVTIATIPW